MRRFPLIPILLLAFSLVLVACGGGNDEAGQTTETGGVIAGDAVRGEALYKNTTIGAASAPGCVTCHSLQPDVKLVGPSHAGLADRAASAVDGQSAEAYLRESIVNPDAHIVDGFSQGVMYPNYGRDLTEQEIADLVAFMLTLN